MTRIEAERMIFASSSHAWHDRWFENIPARRAAGDAMRALKQACAEEKRSASARDQDLGNTRPA